MITLFKKKTTLQKLEIRLNSILQEAFELSSTNRKKSDEKIVEAEQIATQIQELKNRT